MELNNQHFEDLYDAMFKLNKLVVAKSSLAASYLIFDFDTSEFLDFNNTYGLSLEDWIKGLDGIRDFLFYNSPENMKIHEYILDEDKALILSYAYKVVLNEIKEISLGECRAIDKYLKLKKEYLWVPDDVDDRFGKFEMQIFEERCNSFFYKIKLGLEYDYESDNDADNSMNSQIKSESNSSVNNKTKTNDKNSTPDYTNSKNLEYRERKMEQSNKEFVHTLSLLTDALNIGTPFAPQLKLDRLIEIEKTFEKLSDKSFLKNLKAFSKNEYEPIFNILDNEKDFNLLKSKIEMEIVEIFRMDAPNLIDFLTNNPKFNLYYLECAQNYRPEGHYELRRYGDIENINLFHIKNSFENAINNLTMQLFISNLEHYLCVSPEGHYHELWMYHTEALLYNFLQMYEKMNKSMRWGEELSKELLKSMIGYSKCIDFHSDSIIAYTNNISSFVMHIFELIAKILDILQKSNINCNLYNEILLEFFIFSVNLHYIFPIQEIFDFINDNIIAELDTRDSLSGKNEAVFKETKDHFEMLNNKGLLGENYTINMDYTIPDYTVVSDMWVHQQVENPMVTIIYIGILFSKVPSPIELEFCFYDKNNKEITLGKSISEKFKVKLGENVQRGGYYGYKITILNSIDIYGFKAKLLNTLNKTVYSSIELEKVNSNDTNGSTNDNDANESTNDGETLNNIAISATSNNSVSMDSSNIKNNSEPGVWIALLILFVGLFLIYRFAILNSKAITDPINDPVPIEQTIAAESVQFEFMNRLAERKKHGELEYISFIEDGYTDLFKDLNYDEILIGIVSTTGLNFRDNNTMDSNIKLILNEKEKIFIFGECDGWYFGINDVEDANETEYGWCSKYYIEAYVYNFNNKEAVPFEEYNN